MGKKEQEEQELGFHTATVDETGRFSLPTDYVETLEWIAGSEDIDAWLLVMGPGRLRLLSNDQTTRSKPLKRLVDRILTVGGDTEHGEPYVGGPAEKAALVTRLLQVTLHPKAGYWRLKLPARLRRFRISDNQRVILLLSGVYIEIWSEDYLEAAWEHPIEDLLD